MENEKKTKQKLIDRNPILCALLFAVLGLTLMQAGAFVINAPIPLVFPAYPADCGPVGVVLMGALTLYLYKRHYRPEYAGCIAGADYSHVWALVIAYGVFLVFTLVHGFMSGAKMAAPTLRSFSLALFAGVTEEAAFRGLMVPTLTRRRTRQSLMQAIWIPAVVFGLVHGFNGLTGANVGATVLQVVNAVAVGVVFCLLFLLSGNILIPMALHFAHDLIAFTFVESINTDGIMTASVTLSDMLDFAAALILCGFALWYFLRGDRPDAALRVWQRKWTIAEETTAA